LIYYFTIGTFKGLIGDYLKYIWFLTCYQSNRLSSGFCSIPYISCLNVGDIGYGKITSCFNIFGVNCWIVLAWNGVLPNINSYNMIPKDHTSTFDVYFFDCNIYGAIYNGVPLIDLKKFVDADIFLANPKSQILI